MAPSENEGIHEVSIPSDRESNGVRSHQCNERRKNKPDIEQLCAWRGGHASEQESGKNPVQNQPGDQKTV
jgi:hypothetical protein